MSPRLPITFFIFPNLFFCSAVYFFKHMSHTGILLLKTLSWYISVKALAGNNWHTQTGKFKECLLKRQFVKLWPECRETIRNGAVGWNNDIRLDITLGWKEEEVVEEKVAVACIGALEGPITASSQLELCCRKDQGYDYATPHLFPPRRCPLWPNITWM